MAPRPQDCIMDILGGKNEGIMMMHGAKGPAKGTLIRLMLVYETKRRIDPMTEIGSTRLF